MLQLQLVHSYRLHFRLLLVHSDALAQQRTLLLLCQGGEPTPPICPSKQSMSSMSHTMEHLSAFQPPGTCCCCWGVCLHLQAEPHPAQRSPAESFFSVTYPFTSNKLLRDQVGRDGEVAGHTLSEQPWLPAYAPHSELGCDIWVVGPHPHGPSLHVTSLSLPLPPHPRCTAIISLHVRSTSASPAPSCVWGWCWRTWTHSQQTWPHDTWGGCPPATRS